MSTLLDFQLLHVNFVLHNGPLSMVKFMVKKLEEKPNALFELSLFWRGHNLTKRPFSDAIAKRNFITHAKKFYHWFKSDIWNTSIRDPSQTARPGTVPVKVHFGDPKLGRRGLVNFLLNLVFQCSFMFSLLSGQFWVTELFQTKLFLRPRNLISSRLFYFYTKDLILNQEIINQGKSH